MSMGGGGGFACPPAFATLAQRQSNGFVNRRSSVRIREVALGVIDNGVNKPWVRILPPV